MTKRGNVMIGERPVPGLCAMPGTFSAFSADLPNTSASLTARSCAGTSEQW